MYFFKRFHKCLLCDKVMITNEMIQYYILNLSTVTRSEQLILTSRTFSALYLHKTYII